MAEVSCIHGWYTGWQLRFIEDPVVLMRALWHGAERFYVLTPAFAEIHGVCAFG